MPQTAVNMYMERLPARLAEWKLGMVQAATIPRMKKEDRRSAVRELENAAYEYQAEKRVVPPAKIKLIGIGVRFETPPSPPTAEAVSPQMPDGI